MNLQYDSSSQNLAAPVLSSYGQLSLILSLAVFLLLNGSTAKATVRDCKLAFKLPTTFSAKELISRLPDVLTNGSSSSVEITKREEFFRPYFGGQKEQDVLVSHYRIADLESGAKFEIITDPGEKLSETEIEKINHYSKQTKVDLANRYKSFGYRFDQNKISFVYDIRQNVFEWQPNGYYDFGVIALNYIRQHPRDPGMDSNLIVRHESAHFVLDQLVENTTIPKNKQNELILGGDFEETFADYLGWLITPDRENARSLLRKQRQSLAYAEAMESTDTHSKGYFLADVLMELTDKAFVNGGRPAVLILQIQLRAAIENLMARRSQDAPAGTSTSAIFAPTVIEIVTELNGQFHNETLIWFRSLLVERGFPIQSLPQPRETIRAPLAPKSSAGWRRFLPGILQ